MGFLSLVPVILAVGLSLITKNIVLSLAIAVLTGCIIGDFGIWGFTDVFMESLGNADFIWIIMCIIMFGGLISLFRVSGAFDEFSKRVNGKRARVAGTTRTGDGATISGGLGRKGTQILAWLLGIFCFEDTMTPFVVGSVMKKLSRENDVSSEKLAYIVDTTSAPVAIMIPFSTWVQYFVGLMIGFGCLATKETAMTTMLSSIPLNFYCILCVVTVPLFALGVIPEFGPMKKAEARMRTEHKYIADGARPLAAENQVSNQVSNLTANQATIQVISSNTPASTATSSNTSPAPHRFKAGLFLNFVLPMLSIIAIAIATYITLGDMRILDAIILANFYMVILLLIQRVKLADINDAFIAGVKEVLPAVLVLAVAYPLCTVTEKLGTAQYVISLTEGFLTPALLPALTFLTAAIISFATGTSWGTFALLIPIVLPLAFSASGGEVSLLVLATLGAVAGGGCFGDHCSPVSDTTVLASMGSGADHIDHVRTQLPYALSVAAVTFAGYLILGFACQ